MERVDSGASRDWGRAMIERAGELAALATAGCRVITALSFESAGKRIASLSLNSLRLCMALVSLVVWGLVTHPRPRAAAVQLAPTGVAASLMATTRILMLPIIWIRGERFGWAGALGAVIAVAGVAILLL
ncbi:hypothetical protein DB30_04500 [Enhygromyxa salina]|uniref:EamA domain-containing protein n=1 Tax=Enhygromyxa salina TaxID=215803 RepID=A0A0C2CZP9_9BACT|nr:hypothetical protein [Enhygromyxa salina]KIG16456.1 hypothetical protein DB30_04500 [Enhygromyxa salina]